MRRLLAIGFVWLCCAGAWAILGSTLAFRSGAASGGLLREVHGPVGPAARPGATRPRGGPRRTARRSEEQHYDEKEQRYYEVEREKDVTTERDLPLESSDVDARARARAPPQGAPLVPDLRRRRSRGRYAFRNDSARRRARSRSTFPLERAASPTTASRRATPRARRSTSAFEDGQARFARRLDAGERPRLHGPLPGARDGALVVRHARRRARAGGGAGARLRAGARDRLRRGGLPAGDALADASTAPRAAAGRGTWRFDQIVGTAPVGIVLPERLNPGPLASKITFFAPVSLLFFFFVTGVLLAARGRSIHPMNYFLLACAFFAFHLLFAYLSTTSRSAPAFARRLGGVGRARRLLRAALRGLAHRRCCSSASRSSSTSSSSRSPSSGRASPGSPSPSGRS